MKTVTLYKQKRVRKYLRTNYRLSDNNLTSYLIIKYHLDHYPTRNEIIKLEHLFFI